MVDTYIKSLISDFGGKDFKIFTMYVYTTLKKQIDQNKKKFDKDKYIKIRKSVLEYIVSNERAITSELRKNKNK